MRYVLIAIAWLNQQPTFATFDDKTACEAAAEYINKNARPTNWTGPSPGASGVNSSMSAACFPQNSK